MALPSNFLGTYLAHSSLRLLYCDLKTICISNVTTDIPETLSDSNEIEITSINCSLHSQLVFSALLALQRTRELQLSPTQITGISTGHTRHIKRPTSDNTEATDRHANLLMQRHCPTSTAPPSNVYFLQADWIPYPSNGDQTAQPPCAHTALHETSICLTTTELAIFRLTRDLNPAANIIGTPHLPALSLHLDNHDNQEPTTTVLTICPNEADLPSTSRH